jgi:hypothetical protein
MFLTNKKSVLWRWIAAALLVLLVASYVGLARASGPTHGGSPWGIGYGIAASALVLLLVAFGWRKRAYRSKVGTLEGWLQAHVYLGVLVLAVVLLHTGFRFEDRVAVATFAVMGLVVLSGLVGAAFYTVYPRLLTEVQSDLSPAETSERLNRLTTSMARLASGRSRAFEGVYREVVSGAIPRGLAGWKLLLGRLPGGGRRGAEAGPGGAARGGRWTGLLARVPPEEQEPLRQLLMLARQHRELHLRLAYQERYKNLLDVWLWVHVPLSVVLLILIAAHVAAAFYFGAV